MAVDPSALDAQTQALAATLRCVVCQNQSLADSHAPLAQVMKEHIREQLAAGQGEAQVRASLVARYGDFVLYEPPFKPLTWGLWLGPLLVLLLGAGLLLRRLRQQAALPDKPAAPASAPDASADPQDVDNKPTAAVGAALRPRQEGTAQGGASRRLEAGLVLAVPLLAGLLYIGVSPSGTSGTTDADTLLNQAVNLAIRQGERGLAGEPERLIQAALRLSPQHVQALALAGSARLDQGDAAGAVRYWEQLLPLVEPGSALDGQIRASIAAAQRPADAALPRTDAGSNRP